jgi:hypothetical protein
MGATGLHVSRFKVSSQSEQFRIHLLVTARLLMKLHTLNTVNHIILCELYLILLTEFQSAGNVIIQIIRSSLHTWRPRTSMCVVTLHYLLCTRTHLYPVTPLPTGSGYFRAKPFPLCIPQHFPHLVILHLPVYEDGTECSETSVYKIQTPENYPAESILHTEQGERLKSRLHIVDNVIFFIN